MRDKARLDSMISKHMKINNPVKLGMHHSYTKGYKSNQSFRYRKNGSTADGPKSQNYSICFNSRTGKEARFCFMGWHPINNVYRFTNQSSISRAKMNIKALLLAPDRDVVEIEKYI